MNESNPEVEVVEADAPENVADDIEQMFEGLTDDAVSVDIWRRAARPPRKYEFIDNLHIDAFSIEVVAAQFGGGDYQVRPKNSSGHYLKNTTRTFRIGGEPVAPERPGPEQPEAEASPQLATLEQLMREVAAELRSRRDAARPGIR